MANNILWHFLYDLNMSNDFNLKIHKNIIIPGENKWRKWDLDDVATSKIPLKIFTRLTVTQKLKILTQKIKSFHVAIHFFIKNSLPYHVL